ncbi:MAG: hypothetical protein NTW95_07385 [Candidatus Aminicenantes bacterium]|nr:hypothetical protein [Candidatus Aminicenantes bacterium]
MTNARKKIVALLALILLGGSSVSCRKKSESEIIAALVADMAASAEKRDADGLIVHLAPDYRDFSGRDREQTAAMVEEYFSRYRGIVIHLLASRIVIESPNSAALETDISLSSGAAQAFRKLIRFSGENYCFSCRLRKEERWLITEAGWEYVALDGLFPESLKILRELFPNL